MHLNKGDAEIEAQIYLCPVAREDCMSLSVLCTLFGNYVICRWLVLNRRRTACRVLNLYVPGFIFRVGFCSWICLRWRVVHTCIAGASDLRQNQIAEGLLVFVD